MRKIFFILSLLLLTGIVLGSTAKIKQYRNFRDFLEGESKGVAIGHQGFLTLAPKVDKIFAAKLPQIWRLVKSGDDLFAGAGNPAAVIKIAASGDTSTIFQSDAASVFALNVDPSGNLWFAPSPGGEIFRYAHGKIDKVADLDVTYVWDILPRKNDLLIATGEPGTIFRMKFNGEVSTFFESNETHIRTLVADSQGQIYAGSADNGLIYRFNARGKPFVLYDSPQTEIFSIIPLENGQIWAAGASEGLQRPVPAAAPVTLTDLTIEGKEKGEGKGETETHLPAPRAFSQPRPKKGAIYKISAKGVARNYWQGVKDRVQSICLRENGTLLVGTGDAGKIYEILPGGEIDLLLDLEPSQITQLLARGGQGVYVATANSGAAFAIKNTLVRTGEYLSSVLDADIYTHWGSLSWKSEGKVELYVRSGNSQKPDKTWSQWAGPLKNATGAAIQAPVARFLQWRAVLRSGGHTPPKLQDIAVGYLQENAPPEIESITIYEPGVAFPEAVIEGKSKRSLNVPQKNGSKARPRSRSWKRETRKGFQSIGWRATDVNNDELIYNVYYKRVDSPAWRMLAEDYRATIFSWDSRALEDGNYVVKVVVSDRKGNAPDRAFSQEKISQPFTIDNTPPEVSALKLARRNSLQITFTARDAGTWISAAYFALDAREWMILYPDDGIADSSAEQFTIPLKDLPKGDHILTVKIYDKNDNVRYRHLNFKL